MVVQHTQVAEHALSNCSISSAHFDRAGPSCFRASMISFLSRQLKKRSLASQHCFREERSGAILPPSADFGGLEPEDEENHPIMNWEPPLKLLKEIKKRLIQGAVVRSLSNTYTVGTLVNVVHGELDHT
ncbi:hypothetical protein FQN57_003156, partial [Myotisia sp. PD_48]